MTSPSNDKVALVTGSSRGIGRGIALRLAQDGFDVVVNDIGANQKGIDSVVQEIQALGRKSLGLACDVTDDVAVHKMIEDIVIKYGHLDVVFANAGIAKVQSLLDSNAADRKTMFDVNVHGVMNTCIAAAKSMVALGIKGRIVCTASIVALRPFPMLGPYSSSKWAVKGFVQVAAMEFARYGIRVNGICPGIVDSDMWDLIDRELGKIENRAVGETRAKYVQDLVLLGRLSVPEDVAKLASFLASSDSEYITGQCMVVDGGVSFA